jgi:hypothetical protein
MTGSQRGKLRAPVAVAREMLNLVGSASQKTVHEWASEIVAQRHASVDIDTLLACLDPLLPLSTERLPEPLRGPMWNLLEARNALPFVQRERDALLREVSGLKADLASLPCPACRVEPGDLCGGDPAECRSYGGQG